MTTPQHMLDIGPAPDEKPDATHFEDVKEKVQEVQLLKSRFDEMSISRNLWVFRKAAMFVFLVYTGYVCEGFEVCLPTRQGDPC